MSRVKQGRSTLIALTALGFGAALLQPGDAAADSAQVMRLAYGVGGPQKEKGGAGNEQPTSVVVQKNGVTYVVTIYMSSNVSDNDRPWQCKCSSVAIDPMMGPTLVADQVQLTSYDGDRPCNHPMAATDGKHVVWTFGSDKGNQANVSTYVGSVDEMCKTEADPKRVSENNNNNEGAPDISYNGASHFTAGYLSTNNNDTSFALGLTLHDDGGTISLEKTYLKGIVAPSNIGRPAIVAAGPDRSLFCAAKGDNRPPEDGVECAWLDTTSGKVLWKKIVAASDPNAKKYMNQPSVAMLDYGRFAVNLQESSGDGKKNNTKGANTSHLFVIEPSDSGYIEKSHKVGLGTYQTHAAICSGGYGVDGKRNIAIMAAPITGVGLPGIQMASYDSNTDVVADKANLWPIGYYGDSGHIANIYGQNPNTQGRDFLRCIGDVPNPGHGLMGGYMKNVATFFVAPHAGRIPGDPKNALFLSLIPGKTDAPVVPEPPKEVTPPVDMSTSAATTSSGDPSTTSGSGGAGAGGGGNNETSGSFPSTQQGSCACSMPGTESSSIPGGLGGLAALGLTIALISRRKEA
ncbi:MAG: MYXO-CTERM sorting domain-containing protein [Byssovorax sp.]